LIILFNLGNLVSILYLDIKYKESIYPKALIKQIKRIKFKVNIEKAYLIIDSDSSDILLPTLLRMKGQK